MDPRIEFNLQIVKIAMGFVALIFLVIHVLEL